MNAEAQTRIDIKTLTSLGFPFLLILLGFMGLRLVFDSSYWSDATLGGHQATLGELLPLQGAVRHRRSRSTIWHDVGKAKPVSNGDTVFTGEKGKASLALFEGGRLLLYPNSLVVVQSLVPKEATPKDSSWWNRFVDIGPIGGGAHSSQVHLRVDQGKAEIKMSEADQIIRLTTPTQQIKLSSKEKSAALIVEVSKGIRLTSTEDAPIQVETDLGVAKTLNTGQALVLNQEVVEEKTLEVSQEVVPLKTLALSLAPSSLTSSSLAPVENSEAQGSTELNSDQDLNQITVRLAWKPLPKAQHYEVRVLGEDGEILESSEVSEPRYDLVLRSIESSGYEYEVTALLEGGEKIESPRIPIKIEIAAPIPKEPPQNAVVSDQGGEENILMAWAKTSLAESYLLEISEDPDFTNVLVQTLTEDNFYGFVPEERGKTYYWRVQSQYENKESAWSEISKFRVE